MLLETLTCHNFQADFCKNLVFWGLHVGSFLRSKIVILRFQEGVQDEAEFETVLVSILVRFLVACECPKLGFRIIGVQFLRILGVAR